MMGHSASVLIALAMMAGAADTEVPSLSHRDLNSGQKFEIRTADRTFRGQLIDRATGECQIAFSSDGKNFTPPRLVYLLGATAGYEDRQMLVLMDGIKVGLRMELGLGDLEQRHRYVTDEVESIRLTD